MYSGIEQPDRCVEQAELQTSKRGVRSMHVILQRKISIFEIDRRTNSYPAQRGREQILYDQNPGADLNKIKPISPQNPRRGEYLEAGRGLDGG